MRHKIFTKFITGIAMTSLALSQNAAGAASAAPTTPLKVSVNFGSHGRSIPISFYGIKDDEGVFPCYRDNAKFTQNLSYMGNKFYRVMQQGMTTSTPTAIQGASWINVNTQSWNEAAILDTLNSLPPHSQIMVCIPKWPYWMNDPNNTKTPGILDPNKVGAYAKFCADLVYIVNVKNKRNVQYWEPYNECDPYYFSWNTPVTINGITLSGPTSMDMKSFTNIFNQCAIAMKYQDPTIRVGGAAFSYGEIMAAKGWAKTFVQETWKNLDFYSCHFYPSYSVNESDATVMDYPLKGQQGTYPFSQFQFWQKTVAQVAAGSPTKSIPVFVDEFNINPSTTQLEARMQNTKGAVFDSLMYVAAARAGVAAMHAHDSVGPYFGKFDLANMWFSPKVSADVIYPGGQLQHLLTNYFVGNLAYAYSPNESVVVPYAINGSTYKSLLLANRSSGTVHVSLASTGIGFSGTVVEYLLSTNANNKPVNSMTSLQSAKLSKDGLDIPAYSVAVLLSNTNAKSGGK